MTTIESNHNRLYESSYQIGDLIVDRILSDVPRHQKICLTFLRSCYSVADREMQTNLLVFAVSQQLMLLARTVLGNLLRLPQLPRPPLHHYFHHTIRRRVM